MNKTVLLERLQRYPGMFECHVSVKMLPQRFDEFRAVCESLGGKAIIIELGSGETPQQPMLGKRLSGDAENVLDDILYLVDALSKEFDITRVKVEAAPRNSKIPANNNEAEGLPPDCYFEHHVKLELKAGTDLDRLRQECRHYDGHLSRNALHSEQEREERFVTQRFYNTGFHEAGERLNALLGFIRQQDIPVLDTIREFNIYDSNIDLDAGWMHDSHS